MTDQALADRTAHDRHTREVAEQEPKHEQWLEEEQTRFRTGNLIRAVAGPPDQVPTGPVVAYVALYKTGVMINYLVPRPSQRELESDDPFAEPLMEAMLPRLEIKDGLGTDFKSLDIDYVDANSSPLRARVSFAPAVQRPPAVYGSASRRRWSRSSLRRREPAALRKRGRGRAGGRGHRAPPGGTRAAR